MFQIRLLKRSFHTSRFWMSDTKFLLSTLRKKTGYPLSNCRKALETCDNNVSKAEEWLKEQALALGWAKAFKLSGRSALQGVIAVTTDKKSASMVELNCETDFVAKNEVFQNLAFTVAHACFSFAEQHNQFENSIAKVDLNALQLKSMTSIKSGKLENEVALAVSQFGENIQLRRALCIKVSDDLLLASCTHPISAERDSVSMGKYGSVLVYKAKTDDENTTMVAKQLCQQIIGMNPSKIGEIDEDHPKENKDNESCLIHQEFIMNNEITVLQVLKENEVSLVDFIRFECGEDLEEESREPVQSVA